jgi:hypothetical protein
VLVQVHSEISEERRLDQLCEERVEHLLWNTRGGAVSAASGGLVLTVTTRSRRSGLHTVLALTNASESHCLPASESTCRKGRDNRR